MKKFLSILVLLLPLALAYPYTITIVRNNLWSNAATSDYHGARNGTGFSGALIAPYARGGAAIPCAACHERRSGTTNRKLLRSSVNGHTGITVNSGNSMKNLCAACHQGNAAAWHNTCNGCHSDSMYESTGNVVPGDGADCAACHGHGKTFVHTGTCCNCHDCEPNHDLWNLGVKGPYDVPPFVPWTYHTF